MNNQSQIRYKQWMINNYLKDDSRAGVFTRTYISGEQLFPSVLSRKKVENFLSGMQLDPDEWSVFFETFEKYEKRNPAAD